MNKKTFLDNLSKIKNKYCWKKEKGEDIRTKDKYRGCPIQAIYHSKFGVWEHYSDCAAELNIYEELKYEIICAADTKNPNNSLRRSMLKRLGLKPDKVTKNDV